MEKEDNVLHGSCLCKSIQFEFDGPIDFVNHCCCSLCRKATGTGSNAIAIVPLKNFRWISGKDNTIRYSVKIPNKEIPRNAVKCKTCGIPLPDSYDNKRMWIQAGLIDDEFEPTYIIYHHLSSKANWVRIPENVHKFDEYPV